MEIIRAHEMEEFANPGVASRQLLYPGNSPSARVTITRVTMEPGAINSRHTHPGAEQVWIVDCKHETVTIYRSSTDSITFGLQETLVTEDLLPGFSIRVADIFK